MIQIHDIAKRTVVWQYIELDIWHYVVLNIRTDQL